MPNRPQELKKMDALLQQHGQDEFLDFAQSPGNVDALHTAVVHLVNHWPTVEQTEELWQYFKRDGTWKQLEKNLVEQLRKARTVDGFETYDSDNITSTTDARLFVELYRARPELYPESVVFIPFPSTKDSVFSIAKGY